MARRSERYRLKPLSRKDVSTENLVCAVDSTGNDPSRGIRPHVELLRHNRERVPYYLGGRCFRSSKVANEGMRSQAIPAPVSAHYPT
jgi:hypothetical protein